MRDNFSILSPTFVGQAALHKDLDLKVPAPFVQSSVHTGARHSHETPTSLERYYNAAYGTDGSVRENLRFAFKYEPLDLRVVYAALCELGPSGVKQWIQEEPTGQYSRRAWFLYERLTGERVDVPDAIQGNYVDVLDAARHYTALPRNSKRHRVRDNLLGTANLCPILRRTRKLDEHIASRVSKNLTALVGKYPALTLARAASYLYTKETRSSFAIEGESPRPDREAKFVKALEDASRFTPAKQELIQLQNSIVDPRYMAEDWRSFQVFVGGTKAGFEPRVDFVCPRPENVVGLMEGWQQLTLRHLLRPHLDPVLAAALSAFAFVFIHPFEDGNGRLHRFLIHAVLAKRGFTPPGLLFPVSAAILRQRHLYDHALEAFSKSILPFIQWHLTSDLEVVVRNDTRDLYRFCDLTPQAEYLYDCVAETVRVDFKEELDFLTMFDAAFTGLQQVVDMPDRRAHLLLKLIMQNGDRLSAKKRDLFQELTDDEIAAIEQVAADAREQVQ